MNGFLSEVARSIISTHGSDINDLNIVFAGRRVQRYFNVELSKAGGLGNPSYTTIDELIRSFGAEFKQAEKLKLLTVLYTVYSKFYPTEPFDKFYSFGELLLTDFDTIDRYMVDAKSLYSIVSDTLTLDPVGDDPAHRAAINFWRTFQHAKASMHEQQQFLQIWKSLYDIYRDYKIALQSECLAYAGMIYRSVAERLSDSDAVISGKYIVIGLNALSKSEQTILKCFQKSGDTSFYWDYNKQWIDDPMAEAGYFIRQNLEIFPQAADFSYCERSNDNIKLKVIDTPSDIAQCKIVSSELANIASLQNGVVDSETAVILTDEKLLIPLLHSIPPTIAQFNISMGYPLNSTLAYLFFERLISMQNRSRFSPSSGDMEFYHTDIAQLLSHPYIAQNELAEEIENSQTFYLSHQYLTEKLGDLSILWRRANRGYRDMQSYLIDVIDLITTKIELEQEQQFMAAIKSSLLKLRQTISGCNIELSTSLYTSLMFEELASQSIDFEGHSGEGLQITAILESRSLDFKNIILLSMSDDNFPSSRPVSSYIPQGLRQGYGMPSITEHSAIWSFYFYRLLQSAENVTMIYCSASDNATSGEPSRYIYQLQYTSPCDIEFKSVVVNAVRNQNRRAIEIDKTLPIIEKLTIKTYSPSALNRYVRCPMSFYFNDVEQITAPDALDETISALDTGNALHKIMQSLYTPIVGSRNAKVQIRNITGSIITDKIDEYLSQNLSSKIELNLGSAHILKTTLAHLVANVVYYDASMSDNFAIVALEDPISGVVDGHKIGGIADRVDRMEDGSIRIVDYKSGADKMEFKSIEELFLADPKGHNNAALQTLIYGVIAARQYRAEITPALYVARKMRTKNFSPLLVMGGEKIQKINATLGIQIEQHILATLGDITNQDLTFTQTEFTERTCSHCPYKTICRR